MKTPHFLASAAAGPETFGLRIVESGTWLATDAQLAGTSESRRRGLLALDRMPPGHALVIAPTQGIHTFGMRFPLDIVGVARDGRVVSVRSDVPRRRLVFSWRAFAIVELAAGAIRAARLHVGDRLQVAIPAAGKLEQSSSQSQTF